MDASSVQSGRPVEGYRHFLAIRYLVLRIQIPNHTNSTQLHGTVSIESELPAFYGTRRFILSFHTNSPLISIQNFPDPLKSISVLSCYLHPGFSSGLFLGDFLTTIFYALPFTTMHTTCHVHLIPVYLITLIPISREDMTLGAYIETGG